MRLANQDWDLYLMEGITSVKRLKYDNSFDFISVPLKSRQININQTIPEKGKN